MNAGFKRCSMGMPAKKKVRESIRKDLEKELMYGFKEEFLQRSQELNARYKVDRGKLIRSWIESGLLDLTDVKRNLLRKIIERIGVVIYERASPREKPFIVFFVDAVAKIAAIHDANEAAEIIKKLFPHTKAVFVAMDKEPEPIKKSKFKHLDEIIIGASIEEIWDKAYELLKELFPIE